MRDHARIEELLSVRALGGLDGGDETELGREMASHAPECDECRRLSAEIEETAARLAFALEPVAVPAALERDTLRRASEAFGAAPETPAAPAPTRRAPWRGLVAAAAAVALFAGGWVAGDLASSGGTVALPSRVVTLQGPAGSLSAAFDPDRSGIYLLGAALERPPSGRVYELWMIRGDKPVRAACFSPGADGSVSTFVDARTEGASAMAVTVESTACPTAPTTHPVLLAQLTRA
jgi:anti-sigma-K factor RskA